MIHLTIEVSSPSTRLICSIVQDIYQATGVAPSPGWQPEELHGNEEQNLLERLAPEVVGLIQALAGDITTLFDTVTAGRPSVIQQSITSNDPFSEATMEHLIQWPSHWPSRLAKLCSWVFEELNHRERERSAPSAQHDGGTTRATVAWPVLKKQLKMGLPNCTNLPRLLAAGSRRSIPVQFIRDDIIQLGWGKRSRWMQSTSTELTPHLGITIAKNNAQTNRLLRIAGLPVPRQLLAYSTEEAVRAAETLGWPVVQKPANLDGGVGAHINLTTPEQIQAAYASASQFSQSILIEEQLQGPEYRLTVVAGQLFWAHERVPAQISGDGITSVAALIA